MIPRPTAACRRALLVILLASALPAVLRADDARLAPLKDLDGFFPFTPPATLDAWKPRAAEVRRRILVSQGLWPMPASRPLNPQVHGTITKGPEAKGNEGTVGYTVSNVSFESAPGLFVTGNLYRPLGLEENQKVPAVLFAHGHWQNARHADQDAAATRKEIAALTGAIRRMNAGQYGICEVCDTLIPVARLRALPLATRCVAHA